MDRTQQFEAERPRLEAIATRILGDHAEAQDIVQQAWLRLHGGGTAADPADDVALADTVGAALHVVLDRLSPRERIAFVLHDSFGIEFGTIAAVLDTTPAAARQVVRRDGEEPRR